VILDVIRGCRKEEVDGMTDRRDPVSMVVLGIEYVELYATNHVRVEARLHRSRTTGPEPAY